MGERFEVKIDRADGTMRPPLFPLIKYPSLTRQAAFERVIEHLKLLDSAEGGLRYADAYLREWYHVRIEAGGFVAYIRDLTKL